MTNPALEESMRNLTAIVKAGHTLMENGEGSMAKKGNKGHEMWVLFANQSEKDILLREELDIIAERHPSRVHLWYTVDRAEPNWPYSVGFVDANMLRDHMPKPDNDTLILACGPPPMIKFACEPSLDALNHPSERRFNF